MTKEHFWPKWLIERTGTSRTGVKWRGTARKVNPKAATLPLCKRCNHDFGQELEVPVSRIFREVEIGDGLSDNEIEILIRWLWKLEGLAWLMHHPLGNYSPSFTLRQRVLGPIAELRPHLTLAISLIDQIDPIHGDAPLGLDSENIKNAIFVSGVFSRIAMMCLLTDAVDRVPRRYFSVYSLGPSNSVPGADAKLFFPMTGFKNDNDAVVVTKAVSAELDAFHEGLAATFAPSMGRSFFR